VKHDKAYPAPDYLRSVVKVGNIDFEGEMIRDTDGSDFVKIILLDHEPGPVILEVSDNGTPERIASLINRLATSNPDLIFNC
jgi:hypothetical protein